MPRHLLASLQVRLAVFVVLLVLGSLWLFALALSARVERELLEQQSGQQLATVGYVAEDIANKIQLRLDSLAAVAASLSPEAIADRDTLPVRLSRHRVVRMLFDRGLIVAKISLDGVYGDYPELPGYRNGRYDVSPFQDVARTDRAAVGPQVQGVFGPQPVVVFAVPIKDAGGRSIAILAGAASLDAPNFLELIQRLKLGRTGSFVVAAPAHGVFVTGTDPSFRLKPLPPPGGDLVHDRWMAGEEASAIGKSSTGVEEVSSSRQVARTGWFVVGRMPVAEAFAPIRRQRALILGLAALISLVAAVMGGLIVRRALAPLASAARDIDAASRGERALIPLPVARHDEVGRLAESFNRLMVIVRQREADLIAAREDLKDIADSLPVAVYRYRIEDDGRSNIMYMSDRFEALVGVPAAEAMRDAQTAFSRIHPDDLPGFLATDRADWARHARSSQQVRAVMADGSIRWMYVEGVPKQLADGRFVNHGFVEDITERKEADTALRQLQERFAVAFRASPIAASIARAADGCFIDVNDKWLHDFGWSREELIGRSSVEVGVWPDAAVRTVWIETLRRSGSLYDHVVRWRRKDGVLRDISVSAEVTEMDGEPCVLAFAADISERLHAERALAESEARNRRIIETANEGIWIVDREMRITFLNQRMADMLGYTQEELLGRCWEELLYPEDMAAHREQIAKRQAGLSSHYERRFRRKDGGELWTQVSGTAVLGPDGGYEGAFGMFTDISHLKEQQRQLQHIAHYDALTGIPNRVLLADRMHQSLGVARRSGRLMAVCYVDLDGFKPINDAFGHESGDRLLVEIAHRLREGLRGGDTVARLGGDEFVLLLGAEHMDECETALVRLLEAVARPLTVAGRAVVISASIGVTVYPFDDADPDTLLRHADQAMYAAKQQGRNRFEFFDPQRDRQARAHRDALDRIAAALTAGEFVLYYQPKVNMREGSVVGVEALIRWQHPQDGLLPPLDFLPVIEDTEVIEQIGEWVIDTALAQWQAWHAQGLDLTVSVNIAARHLARKDFVARLTQLLQAHPEVPAHRLELEVVETAALEDIEGIARLIEECRQLGVSFALDDFGTGYSSLTYMKRLPADTLKIDQSFVRDMLRDPEDCAIVEGVIGLTRVFHRHVVAEGVETVEHGVLLLSLGCDIGQGYGIARPMPSAALADWVRNWRPDPSWGADTGSAWPTDDLPLAVAEAEQRRWVEEVESGLAGSGAVPELDAERCRFGVWLAGAGRRRYGARPEFEQVRRLHWQAHQLATELRDQSGNGGGTAARRRLPELHGLRDALLSALRAMMSDSRMM